MLLLFTNSSCKPKPYHPVTVVTTVTVITSMVYDPPPPPTPQIDKSFGIVTEKLYNKIANKEAFVNLKFYVSKDIKLEISGIETMPDYDKNKIMEIRHQDIIYLKAGTSGRVRGIPNGKRLEIAFEKAENEESYPTFVFIQKHPDDDRYYLETMAKNKVKYKNIIWNVSYSHGLSSHFKNLENIGNDIKEEPYLIYELDKQTGKTEREIKGLD